MLKRKNNFQEIPIAKKAKLDIEKHEAAKTLCLLRFDNEQKKLNYNLKKIHNTLYYFSQTFNGKNCCFFHKRLKKPVDFHGNKYTLMLKMFPLFIKWYPSVKMLLYSDIDDIRFILTLDNKIFETGDGLIRIFN